MQPHVPCKLWPRYLHSIAHHHTFKILYVYIVAWVCLLPAYSYTQFCRISLYTNSSQTVQQPSIGSIYEFNSSVIVVW